MTLEDCMQWDPKKDRVREVMRHGMGMVFGVGSMYLFNQLGFTEHIPLYYEVMPKIAPYVQFGYEGLMAASMSLMVKGSLEPVITIR